MTIRDNGRGIPVDPHPKYKNKSALEVILTTLHSGGKFSNKVYETSGGLHGVGISVVNALSDRLDVEVARDKTLYKQSYSRGAPKGPLKEVGAVNKRGTSITFHPDPEIFTDKHDFIPARLYRMARSKAYLFRGVEIRWKCDESLIGPKDTVPKEEKIHFPGGLADFLANHLESRETLIPLPFAGNVALNGNTGGKVEWAVNWVAEGEGINSSYCNTVPTPQGGTHEAGMRSGLTRALKAYGDLSGNRRAAQITPDDVMDGACVLLSLFMRNPQFQGQTKEKLASVEASKMVENTIKDHFDHWLSGDPTTANALLNAIIDRARRAPARQEGQGVQPQDGDAPPAAARQARRLLAQRGGGHRDFPRRRRLGRRLGEVGAQPRDASDPAVARQDPQCRLGLDRQAARQSGNRRSGLGARLRRRRALRRLETALRARHHHDGRRCRRRALSLRCSSPSSIAKCAR